MSPGLYWQHEHPPPPGNFSSGQSKIKKYKRALKQDPESIEANVQLGMIYIKGNEYDAALPYLLKASQISPKLDGLNDVLFDLYREKDQLEKALPYLEKMVETETKANASKEKTGGQGKGKKGQFSKKLNGPCKIIHQKPYINQIQNYAIGSTQTVFCFPVNSGVMFYWDFRYFNPQITGKGRNKPMHFTVQFDVFDNALFIGF